MLFNVLINCVLHDAVRQSGSVLWELALNAYVGYMLKKKLAVMSWFSQTGRPRK